jgi:ATPase subunit of ABC transporter with duplicated ATPase domains
MAEKIIFQLHELKKYYGQRLVLNNITLSFLEGAKIGVVGPNGAGKSTLLRIMSGLDKQFEGTAKKLGDYAIGYLSQEPPLTEDRTVGGNLDEAVEPLRAIERRYNELAEAGDMGEEFEHLTEEMTHKEIWELDSRIEQAATALCLPPLDADVRKLSGGERRRVALAKLLMSHPEMLLLDEPTNHLDAETIEWLEEHLKNYHGTVILITHDRYFLDNVVEWMLEVERTRAVPYKGNYSEYLAQKSRNLDVKRQADSKADKVLAKDWRARRRRARRSRRRACSATRTCSHARPRTTSTPSSSRSRPGRASATR